MEQFAVASIYPRSFAWLLLPTEWEQLETTIQYNCALLGGSFNAIVPLTHQGTLSEIHKAFLTDYDPDIVVLAPGMKSDQVDLASCTISPFATVQWDQLTQIVSSDPWSGGGGISASPPHRRPSAPDSNVTAYVATEDINHPNSSRLALVACGDVEPRQPIWSVMDDDVSLDSIGYREMFLAQFIARSGNLFGNG